MANKITFTDNEDGTVTTEIILNEESFVMVLQLSFDDFITMSKGFAENGSNQEIFDVVQQGTIIPNDVESGFFT